MSLWRYVFYLWVAMFVARWVTELIDNIVKMHKRNQEVHRQFEEARKEREEREKREKPDEEAEL